MWYAYIKEVVKPEWCFVTKLVAQLLRGLHDCVTGMFNPSRPNINMHILLTVLHVFSCC